MSCVGRERSTWDRFVTETEGHRIVGVSVGVVLALAVVTVGMLYYFLKIDPAFSQGGVRSMHQAMHGVRHPANGGSMIPTSPKS